MSDVYVSKLDILISVCIPHSFFFFPLVKKTLNRVLETVAGIYREAIGQLLSFHESATSSDSGTGIQLQIKTLEHRCMSL